MSEIARYYPTENAHINGRPVPKGTYLVKGSDYEVLEARIENLETQLKEANEVAEFYGADRNWHRRWKDNSAIDVSEEIDGVVDDEDLYWSEDRQMEVGGKRARAYLKKWEEK